MFDRLSLYASLALAAGLVIVAYQRDNLKAELGQTKSSLNKVIANNGALSKELNSTRELYQKQAQALIEAQNKRTKEVRYVTRYKDRIVKDNNATCIDTLNNVVKRLRHDGGNYADTNP